MRISEEAHRAWMQYVTSEGVTLTGLLEVAGRRGPASLFNPKLLPDLLVEVRQLDHDRRAAGGPRPSKKPSKKPRSV